MEFPVNIKKEIDELVGDICKEQRNDFLIELAIASTMGRGVEFPPGSIPHIISVDLDVPRKYDPKRDVYVINTAEVVFNPLSNSIQIAKDEVEQCNKLKQQQQPPESQQQDKSFDTLRAKLREKKNARV